nr:MAG TPA: hypothetical protein [Caudoviricetes sp.]
MNFWKSFFNVKSTILLLSLTFFIALVGVVNPKLDNFELYTFLGIIMTLLSLWVIETNQSMNKYFDWHQKKNGL